MGTIPPLLKSKYYRLSDFTNDEKNIYPKLDIASDIKMMGNYFDQDYTKMKAYTEFSMKIDWYKVMKTAKDDVKTWIASIQNYATVTASSCAIPYKAPDSASELRKKKIMQEFTNDYTKASNYYGKQGNGVYDEDYILAYKAYEKKVDAALDAENAAYEKKMAAEDDQYLLYKSLTKALESDYTQCYTASYPANGTS